MESYLSCKRVPRTGRCCCMARQALGLAGCVSREVPSHLHAPPAQESSHGPPPGLLHAQEEPELRDEPPGRWPGAGAVPHPPGLPDAPQQHREEAWKQGKRKAEKGGMVGASSFLTLRTPPSSIALHLQEVESKMDGSRCFPRKVDDSAAAQPQGMAFTAG
ncbi:hypothetical protein P7K49_033491, partial [Saguinus oedipus]